MVASDSEDHEELLQERKNQANANKESQKKSQKGGSSSSTSLAVADADSGWSWNTPEEGEDSEKSPKGYWNPFRDVYEWVAKLFKVYGWKLCVILILSQHVLKGFVFAYMSTSLDFVFRYFSVPGPRIQIYKAVAMVPWSLKPLFGIVSDKYPLFGYHKSSYMIVTTILSIIALGYVGMNGLLHYNHDHAEKTNGAGHDNSQLKQYLNLEICVVCFFFGFMQISMCDLLTEARYVEAMRKHPELGPDLMTYVWAGISLGGLCGLASIGFVLEHYGPFVPSLISAIMCSLILIPLCLGYMGERSTWRTSNYITRNRWALAAQQRQQGEGQDQTLAVQQQGDSGAAPGESPTRRRGPNTPEIDTEEENELADQMRNIPTELVFLAIFMGITALCLVLTGLYQGISVQQNFIMALLVGCTVLFFFMFLTSPKIAKMNLFFFLQTSFAISIEGATFYFFTDDSNEFKDGPHFSIWFYTTGVGLVASVCNMIGMFIYNHKMKHWRYHGLFVLSNLLVCFISLAGIMVYTRFNRKIGIPDHFFVLGGAVLASIFHQWMWIPGVVLLSQLCPKGVEATMYALLAGCHNVGVAVGQYNGAFVLNYLSVKPSGDKGEGAQFENLWIAALIQCLLPMITLFLLPYLIPNATQTEKLLQDDATGCDGSYYRRWFKGENLKVQSSGGTDSDVVVTDQGKQDQKMQELGQNNGETKVIKRNVNLDNLETGGVTGQLQGQVDANGLPLRSPRLAVGQMNTTAGVTSSPNSRW